MNNFAWEQYHEFIKYTHRYKVRLGDDDVREMLIQAGVRIEVAKELSTVYLHCRNVLYRKRKWEGNSLYSFLNTKSQKEKLIKEYGNEIKFA